MRQACTGLMWHYIYSHLLAGFIATTCKCNLIFILSVLKEFCISVNILHIIVLLFFVFSPYPNRTNIFGCPPSIFVECKGLMYTHWLALFDLLTLYHTVTEISVFLQMLVWLLQGIT
jgi:hypothetical protein